MNVFGALFILFAVMSTISIIGLIFMFLLKSKKATKTFIVFMAAWSMFIAWMNADGAPSNMIREQLIAWGFGALGLAGLLVSLFSKNEKSLLLAKILVTASILLGMIDLFF